MQREPKTMQIQLNGESREVGETRSLEELLAELGLPLATLLVEHNGDALRREEWKGRNLAEGDRVEVIRIVAGG